MSDGKLQLFGYYIENRSIQAILDHYFQDHKIAFEKPLFVACANPHSLVIASKDPLFHKALRSADILLPDGSGIVLAARLLKQPIHGKIAGYDFFYSLTQGLNARGGSRYFFLGSTEYVLVKIEERLKLEFPKINVCGTYSPPFKKDFDEKDTRAMIRAINESNPDVLWVGMTAPKQEKWIYANKERLNVKVIGAIGAVFDFYAGTKKRSSEIWIKLGLEWLPRFLREPRRLWERNLKSTPIFLYWVLREKIVGAHRS